MGHMHRVKFTDSEVEDTGRANLHSRDSAERLADALHSSGYTDVYVQYVTCSQDEDEVVYRPGE